LLPVVMGAPGGRGIREVKREAAHYPPVLAQDNPTAFSAFWRSAEGVGCDHFCPLLHWCR